MATPVIGIRIPPEILELIDARAIDGKTRTDVIIDLLRAGLGMAEPLGESGASDRLTSLDSRLTDLEADVRRVLDDRLTELETNVKQLLDNRRTPNSLRGQIEGSEGISQKRTNTRATAETPTTDDSQGAKSLICPKCGSSEAKAWGKGKLRADGSRGQKILCQSCGKFSMI